MPVKRFAYVNFNPPLWSINQDNPSVGQEPVMAVSVHAPDGAANRDTLRTKVFQRISSPHPAFNAYNVVHDNYWRKTEYASNGDDTTVEITRVYPEHFGVYELRNEPGTLYANTSPETLKELFRRHREDTGHGGNSISLRNIHMDDLERILVDAEVVGYTLLNVQSQPPIDRVQASGNQVNRNAEVQGMRNRAERIQALDLELQGGGRILPIRIRDDGAITFLSYPGDSPALDVIQQLERLITSCSNLESLQVRPGRRG